MYTEQAINSLKRRIDIIEVIGELIALKKEGTNNVACCPFHNERTPSFKVSEKKQIYKCFGCGKTGDSIQFLIDYKQLTFTEAIEYLAAKYNVSLDTIDDKPKSYVLPTWKNQTNLSEKIVQYFESRKISQKTLIALKITDGMEWMPQTNSERMTMHFNYFREGVLTNVKYRDSKKNFKLHKNAELILYNIDALKDTDEAFIVEGEMDALSLHEAGIQNVVSVPNGANKEQNNLAYIDNSWEQIKHIKRWHLALDNDFNGRKLREELSERFGKGVCDYIEFKDCKDANECLTRYGINGIIESVSNKKEFPLEGVFTINDYENDINDMYVNGLDRGIDVELPNFDLRLVKGYIYTFTGIPSHGKSEFVDELAIRSIIKADWKGAYYSPENKPTQLHFSKMARKIVGKHWDGYNKMTKEEKNLVMRFLNKRVWFIKPEKDFTLTSILNQIRDIKTRYGLDFFVIDAWNKLEHKDNDTHAVGRALDELEIFCATNNLLCFLVAHPTKIERDKKTGKYLVPTLYSISGSSNFYNKTDVGVCIYRDFDTNETFVYRQKVKFDHWGTEGYSIYKFDIPSKRYFVDGCYDATNWITKQVNQNSDSNVSALLQNDNDFDF